MTKTLKIALVRPEGNGFTDGSPNRKYPMPNLTLALLAGMMPKKVNNHDIALTVHDEFIKGPYDGGHDIVLISSLTTQEPRVQEIYRQIKTQEDACAKAIVIRGGIHATGLPISALQSADTVFRGEITEFGLKKVLEIAVENPEEKRIFRQGGRKEDDIHLPKPDYSFIGSNGHKRYYLGYPIITSAGCPFACSFCSVTSVLGSNTRFVSPDSIELQIKAASALKKIVPIYDDNFLATATERSISHCKHVALLLHYYGVRWVAELTARTFIDAIERERKIGRDFIKFLADCGLWGLYFGFESVRDSAGDLKKLRPVSMYKELIHRLHESGLAVLGAFVIGLEPDETVEDNDRILEFCTDTGLDFAQFSINTVFPGTQAFIDALSARRIKDINFRHFDTSFEVMDFPGINPGEYEERLQDLYQRFYGLDGIVSRSLKRLTHALPRHLAAVKNMMMVGAVNAGLHQNNGGWENRRQLLLQKDPVIVPDYGSDYVRGMMEEDVFVRGKPDGFSEEI